MQVQALYPLTFIPQLRHYVWGGRNLETLYNRTLPPGITAESWEVSGHPAACTPVESGPLAGKTLSQLLETYGVSLVGSRADWALRRSKFPLLVKLLDATQNLSVQVHPNDNYAITHENGELGKTEMWYVLHAPPDAKTIFGLAPGTSRENFRRAITDNTLEGQLHYLPIKPGDAIFVQTGSVHALLAGTMVAEIQQNSDVTYRVYDWGRVDAAGQSRELHIDKALDVINFDQVTPKACQPKLISSSDHISRSEICRCRYFVVEKVHLTAGATYQGHTDGSSMEIWGTVQGQSQLNWFETTINLPAIRFSLLPANLGRFTITAQTATTMLRTYLP